MANCAEMKKDDIFVCKICGLEMQVIKPCSCVSGPAQTCTVPLKCCNQEMARK